MVNVSEWGYGQSNVTPTDNNAFDRMLIQVYRSNGFISSCIDKNATQTASAIVSGIRYLDATGQPIPNGDCEQALHNLNGLDLFSFIKTLVVYLDSVGRAYLLKTRGTNSPTRGLALLMSHCVYPVRDERGWIKQYRYQVGETNQSGSTTYSPDDLIVFRYPDPLDIYGGGLSPLAKAIRDIGLEQDYKRYQHRLIKRRGQINGILETSNPDSTDEELRRKEVEIKQKLRSDDGGILVTPLGKGRFSPVEYGPVDLAALQISHDCQRVVQNALDMPEGLMTKDANRANADAAAYQHAFYGIAPRVAFIVSILNETLGREFATTIVCDSPVPDDYEFELRERQQKLTSGVLTLNERRQLLGMEPAPGGDVLTPEPTVPANPPVKGDREITVKHLATINRQVSTGILPRAAAISQIAHLFGLDETIAKTLVGFPVNKECGCGACKKTPTPEPAAAAQPQSVETPKVFETPAGEKAWRESSDFAINDGAKKIQAVMVRHFDRMKQVFLAQCKCLRLGVETKELPKEFVPMSEWTDAIAHDVKPILELSAKNGADQLLARVGASPDVFHVMPSKINAAMDKQAIKLALSTIQTTTKNANDALAQVKDEIRQGLISGDSVAELTDRVGQVFENASDDRCYVIAATESSRAMHSGQKMAAVESGLVKGWKFLASSDCCDSCAGHNGAEIPLDGQFNEKDDYGEGLVPVHPNCRCTMLEVLKEGAD